MHEEAHAVPLDALDDGAGGPSVVSPGGNDHSRRHFVFDDLGGQVKLFDPVFHRERQRGAIRGDDRHVPEGARIRSGGRHDAGRLRRGLGSFGGGASTEERQTGPDFSCKRQQVSTSDAHGSDPFSFDVDWAGKRPPARYSSSERNTQ